MPDDAEPYWWGNYTLTFRRHGRPIWEAEIPEAGWSTGRSAYVKHERGFGWVLVLTLTHDKAREVLDRLALPDHAGAPDAADVKDWRNGHASRWSYWAHDESDAALSDTSSLSDGGGIGPDGD